MSTTFLIISLIFNVFLSYAVTYFVEKSKAVSTKNQILHEYSMRQGDKLRDFRRAANQLSSFAENMRQL